MAHRRDFCPVKKPFAFLRFAAFTQVLQRTLLILAYRRRTVGKLNRRLRRSRQRSEGGTKPQDKFG